MAKPIAIRESRGLRENSSLPMLKVDEPVFWSPPKGMLLTPRISKIPLEYSAGSKNVILSEMTQRSRSGTSKLETLGFTEQLYNILGIVGFVTPNQIGYLIRLSDLMMQVWNGSWWDNPLFTGFTGGRDSYWSYANWGYEILMCNGVNKIFRYNPVTGVVGYLDESSPAKHITVFGGRVIMCNVDDKPYRVKWSVKNNNEDYTGDGSGYEDLFSAPGGRVDTVHGCFPITDDTALLIREQTIWQMSVTGNVLKPFRFSRIASKLGTRYRRAIAEVPGGYVVITNDNIKVVGIGQIQTIGDEVYETLIPSITDPDAAVGRFDEDRAEYRLAVGPVMWRYSFREKGWTKDEHPNIIRDFTKVDFDYIGRSIDQLAGTIDTLIGTIDEQRLTVPTHAMLMVSANSTTLNSTILKEDEAAFWDWRVPEVGGGIITQASAPIEIITGMLTVSSVRDKIKILECQLEYEAGHAQFLVLDYSTNKGATWIPYSQITADATTGPKVISFRKTITSERVQLRLHSPELGALRVISFMARMVQEAKVHP